MKILLLLFLVASCGSSLLKGSPREGKTTYSYSDEAGTFRFFREYKQIKSKIITRTQLIDTKGSQVKALEKSIIVSQIGSIQAKNKRLLTVRPLASEFTVWLEGKKYLSRMKLNSRAKTMTLTLDSPEAKWQGTSEIKFPKGKYFCFFSQIPECLYHNYLLTLATENKFQKFDFYVIWDSYPYIQDQLTQVGRNLFSSASIKFDEEIKGQYRYILEVEGQMVLYHFTKSFDLAKVAWISQGITIAPPGEEITEDE